MTPKEAFNNLFANSGKILGFDEMYVPINFLGKPKGLRDKLCKQVDEALTELEELKQEIKDRQETEESLGKELIKLGDELEALKKRDTPMQITQASRFTDDTKLYGMYACNNCHEVIPYIIISGKRIKPNFCYRCGQRLDWSDEK